MPSAPRRSYRAILFDLFGTLVFFKRVSLASSGPAALLHADLRTAVERELPGVESDDFIAAVRDVSRTIAEARRETHVECSSAERFRRVLERFGVDDVAAAERLCRAHMRGLAEATEMPASHLEILGALASRHRLALVSNFDHGPTAREILHRFGLAPLLEHVVISDEFGWRKPRPEIFRSALDALGVPAADAIFVGDTPFEDVEGARRAELDAAWINARGETFPAELAPPVVTLTSLSGLVAHLR